MWCIILHELTEDMYSHENEYRQESRVKQNENKTYRENDADGGNLAAGSYYGDTVWRYGSAANGFAPDNRKLRGIGGIGHHQHRRHDGLRRYRDFARLGHYRGRVDYADRGGAYHRDDGLAKTAKNDLVTAYDDAAGRTPVTTIGTELGGQTLLPGVYASASGTFEITGTLTLNAQGNPDAVFIFLMNTTLVTATRSVVSFINGARYCRVFWKVGSSATLGEYSTFRGHIFALTSITANKGAFIEGQLLARNGAVTLNNNRIINGFCASATSPYGPEAGYWSNGVWYPTSASPTRLPATGDDTSGITTLGILSIFAGIAFVLAGVYLYTSRQRKARS